MQLKSNLFFFIFFLFIVSSNYSFAIENIIVKGNKNISTNTIFSLAPSKIQSSDVELLDEYQKKLFGSGFFESVQIKIENKKIIILVKENPLINFFYIEGIKKKELEEAIYKISKIKENSIFQPHLINEDLQNISTQLKNMGYLKNALNYQIIKIKDNKINLFYKVSLNNKFKINRIFFIGNKSFKSSVLSDVIYSAEHGWWKFLSNSTTPSESSINFDISKLKNFYLNNGFYDVQINSNSIQLLNDSYVNLVYSINSGEKYYFGKVDLVDESNFLKQENMKFLQLKLSELSNELYSSRSIRKFIDFSNNYLSKFNFNLAIDQKLKKSSSNKIDLTFLVSDLPNKQIVETIRIIGNSITDDFVIRNKVKFSEGDIFNSEKLNTSIDILKSSGLFKSIYANLINTNENNIIVEIKVEEQATGEISAGAAAGSSGAAITGGINEKNFLGKGLNLNANFNIGTQKVFGSINYINPDYNNTGNKLKTSFFIENNEFDNASYENKLIGASTSYTYEVYDEFFLSPGAYVDFDSLNANPDASISIKRREGDYFTSKIIYDIFKNTKNREFMPSEGYTIGFGQGLSLISDIPYLSNSFFGSFYNEYKPNFIGSIKYNLSSINGFDENIKFSDRLFVTANNLRGFSSRGIGPKLDNDFIGGNYSFFTSLSSTIPNGLPEKWNAQTNIFFDSANVWGVDDNSTDDSNYIRTSVGFGFSWISPLGPISITYAEPITKKSTDDVQQFDFKIGTAF